MNADEWAANLIDGPPLEDPEVHTPSHYLTGGIETIDFIEAKLGPAGFRAYCTGQVIKYLARAEHKGRPLQDLEKAKWYLSRLIDRVGAEGEPTEPRPDGQAEVVRLLNRLTELENSCADLEGQVKRAVEREHVERERRIKAEVLLSEAVAIAKGEG